MARIREQLDGMVISDTSIKQPVLISMVMLLVLVLGLVSYRSMAVNLLPDISLPTISVRISYPGAGPEDMAEQVAKPIEDQLNTLSGLSHITSQSTEGNTQFIVEFNTEVNVDRALQDVRDKVNATIPSLPTDVKSPVFQKFDPNQQPILTVALASKGDMTPLQLRTLVDDTIVPRIQQAEGVGSVTTSGGDVRQINVYMNLNKLKAFSILPSQISQAINNANANQGLGTVNTTDQDISLRAPSQIQQPSDIAAIQITGTPYRIGDVATIEDGVAEVQGYSRLDGKDAIALSIRRQSGTNLLDVATAVKKELNQVFADYPDLTYTLPSDQSTQVSESTNSAIEELIISAIAAMLVVLLFFRNLRNTLVTVSGLPVIMIGTFAIINLFGITINLISLLALSVSVGLVIDDAIVVRENIFRHMERGETPLRASSRGTAQVALSVLAMSLTVIAVFLPVTFTSGITGIIFKSFGITVASSMAISLVEAFTLAPMLSAYLFKQKKGAVAGEHGDEPRKLTADEELLEEANEEMGRLERGYEGLLAWTLRHRWVVILVTLMVLGVSVYAATGLKFSFFPATDSGEFAISFQQTPGTPLAKTDALARQAEAILLKDPDIEAVQSIVGGEGTAETASFQIKLHKGAATLPVEDRLKTQLGFLPTLAFGKPNFMGASTAITARDIQVSVRTTEDVSTLLPVLQQLQGQAQQSGSLTDIDSTYKPGKPELQFHLNPAKIGSLGFTNQQIATSVRALINGDTAATYRSNGKDTDIVVRLPPSQRASTDDIRALSVPTANGNVALSSLADVNVTSSPTTVRRYDRLNQVLIGANVANGLNVSQVQQQLNAQIKQLTLPTGTRIEFLGQTQNQTEGFTTLLIAMGLAVLFVYMVLASQFGSFIQPIVIMLAMPFSFLGAFLALRLTGIDLSIFGMIGLIMLLGLVVKNSILLVDFANRLIGVGMEKNTALERAGAIRLRPILMTTMALVVGSLPTAIGLGEGSETRRPLAIVVIGGLITSTLMTLLVVPTAYSLLESIRAFFGRVFRRRTPVPVPTPPSAGQELAFAAATPSVLGNVGRVDGAKTDGQDRSNSSSNAKDVPGREPHAPPRDGS